MVVVLICSPVRGGGGGCCLVEHRRLVGPVGWRGLLPLIGGGVTCCWGSEGSAVFGGWLFGAWLCWLSPVWGWLGGVGGLFGFCIVDASIFVVFVVLVCDKL